MTDMYVMVVGSCSGSDFTDNVEFLPIDENGTVPACGPQNFRKKVVKIRWKSP